MMLMNCLGVNLNNVNSVSSIIEENNRNLKNNDKINAPGIY